MISSFALVLNKSFVAAEQRRFSAQVQLSMAASHSNGRTQVKSFVSFSRELSLTFPGITSVTP